MAQYLIGVDVGTGSARAGVFDAAGGLLATARRPLAMHREDGGIVEQSSEQIWQAVCESVQESVTRAGIAPARSSCVARTMKPCRLAIPLTLNAISSSGWIIARSPRRSVSMPKVTTY